MKWLQKKVSAIVLVALAIFAVGCATPGTDAGLMSDITTERSVLRALYNEPDLTGDPIIVGCIDGVVTLSGFVENENYQAHRQFSGLGRFIDNNVSLR